jgi:hypothetical protein
LQWLMLAAGLALLWLAASRRLLLLAACGVLAYPLAGNARPAGGVTRTTGSDGSYSRASVTGSRMDSTSFP